MGCPEKHAMQERGARTAPRDDLEQSGAVSGPSEPALNRQSPDPPRLYKLLGHRRALLPLKRPGLKGRPRVPQPTAPLGGPDHRNEPGPGQLMLPKYARSLRVCRKPRFSRETRRRVLERGATAHLHQLSELTTLPPARAAQPTLTAQGTAQPGRNQDGAEP